MKKTSIDVQDASGMQLHLQLHQFCSFCTQILALQLSPKTRASNEVAYNVNKQYIISCQFEQMDYSVCWALNKLNVN